MKSKKVIAIFVVTIFAHRPDLAGVIVTQNVLPGATSWPGISIISTITNFADARVGESFKGGNGNTNLSQTFTVSATNCVLSTIDLYASSGSGTGLGTNITLKLYDLGIQVAPNPSPYDSSIMGADLLGSGAGLSVSYVNQAAGILEFDFTRADQVTLTNGHLYAFELTGVTNTTPIF